MSHRLYFFREKYTYSPLIGIWTEGITAAAHSLNVLTSSFNKKHNYSYFQNNFERLDHCGSGRGSRMKGVLKDPSSVEAELLDTHKYTAARYLHIDRLVCTKFGHPALSSELQYYAQITEFVVVVGMHCYEMIQISI